MSKSEEREALRFAMAAFKGRIEHLPVEVVALESHKTRFHFSNPYKIALNDPVENRRMDSKKVTQGNIVQRFERKTNIR